MKRDPRLSELLRVLDPPRGFRPWFGGAGTAGALRGVSPEQAAWRPAAGRPAIWDLTLHIAYWEYAVRRHLEGGAVGGFPRRPADWPSRPDRPDAEAWAADRLLVAEEHRRLVAAIGAFDPRRLDDFPPGRRGHSFMDLLVGIVQHDAHHTGQIQLLKRLWPGPRPRRRRPRA